MPLLRSVLGAEEKRTSKDYPKGAKESEPDLEGKRADFAVADVQEEKAAFSSAKSQIVLFLRGLFTFYLLR